MRLSPKPITSIRGIAQSRHLAVWSLIAFAAVVVVALAYSRWQAWSVDDVPTKELHFTREPVALRALPVEMQGAMDATKPDEEITRALSRNGSLHLDDACLVLSKPSEPPQQFALSAYTLRLNGNSCIKTNGHSIDITVVNLIGSSGAVTSFSEDDLRAADAAIGQPGAAGRDAGRIRLKVLKQMTLPLTINLVGQSGGRGGSGAVGPAGGPGPRGADATPGLFDCRSGGQDGGQGGRGGDGSSGAPGGKGGDGGTVILLAAAAAARQQVLLNLAPGKGGEGGAGGPGGPGGPGGEGGSGRGPCGGGRGGRAGPPGNFGPAGEVGAPGRPGRLE